MTAAILSIEQAAALLQVGPPTLRPMAADGQVPAAKVGKFWRFDETLLREWVARRAAENDRTCLSSVGKAPRIGRFASNSLGERLDALLGSQTEPSPKNSRSSFAVVTGGKSG